MEASIHLGRRWTGSYALNMGALPLDFCFRPGHRVKMSPPWPTQTDCQVETGRCEVATCHREDVPDRFVFRIPHMGVSENGDTPKWMVYNGNPIQMDDWGVPPFQETSITYWFSPLIHCCWQNFHFSGTIRQNGHVCFLESPHVFLHQPQLTTQQPQAPTLVALMRHILFLLCRRYELDELDERWKHGGTCCLDVQCTSWLLANCHEMPWI